MRNVAVPFYGCKEVEKRVSVWNQPMDLVG